MKGMKTGGRKKGTPNKVKKPVVPFLEKHSAEYFMPSEALGGRSQFDVDTEAMAPEARANLEVKILEFHTPRKKAVDVGMNAQVNVRTIEDKLRSLCGNDAEDEEDDDDDD